MTGKSLGATGREVEAYTAGRQAWDRGIPKGSNPYSKSLAPDLWKKWLDGWEQARGDSQREA